MFFSVARQCGTFTVARILTWLIQLGFRAVFIHFINTILNRIEFLEMLMSQLTPVPTGQPSSLSSGAVEHRHWLFACHFE